MTTAALRRPTWSGVNCDGCASTAHGVLRRQRTPRLAGPGYGSDGTGPACDQGRRPSHTSPDNCRRGPGYHDHPVAGFVGLLSLVLACVAGPVAGAGAVMVMLMVSTVAITIAVWHRSPEEV
jgi:hypothetical protein